MLTSHFEVYIYFNLFPNGRRKRADLVGYSEKLTVLWHEAHISFQILCEIEK